MYSPEMFEELPPHLEAMALGSWEQAFHLLKAKASAGGPGLSPEEVIHLAVLQRMRGEPDEADAALSGLEKGSDPEVAVEAIVQLVNLRLSAPAVSLDDMESLLLRAAALAGADGRLKGMVAYARAHLCCARSEYNKVGEALEEARRLLEDARDEGGLARVLDSLAMYHESRGEREKALSCYALSLAKKAPRRDLHGMGITLGCLGRFYLKNGQPRPALSCFLDSLQIVTRVGDRRAEALLRLLIGEALTELGRLDEAEKELAEGLSLARARWWRDREVHALRDQARVVAIRGDRDRALAILDGALYLLPEDPTTFERAQVLLARGDLLLDAGKGEKARNAFQDARTCFAAIGSRQDEARAIRGLLRVSERFKEWNSCIQLIQDGVNCLSTIVSPLSSSFEKSFYRVHVASQGRVIPPSIGPYRVLTRIGGGAYGEVYRALDGRGGSRGVQVAIKVLRLDGLKNAEERQTRIERFRRECEILSRIEHPNVVRLIGKGEEPVPYLVQEFIGGGDLSGLLQEGKPLPPDAVLRITLGVLRGLAALHDKGIVHRDLKPGNVLLRENGEPVIADFGIARMVDLTALTLESVILGTLGYMAPEQLRGERSDERSDIYAVGVILFQLLSGRLPYETKDLRGVLQTMEQGKPADLAELRPDLPGAVGDCVARCLAVESARRYEKVSDLMADIEAAFSGTPPLKVVAEGTAAVDPALFARHRP